LRLLFIIIGLAIFNEDSPVRTIMEIYYLVFGFWFLVFFFLSSFFLTSRNETLIMVLRTFQPTTSLAQTQADSGILTQWNHSSHLF
jgi:hypothetical protein